jgi:hypothetical protein
MKTREINVWVNEAKGFYVECIPYNDLEKPFVKAKLIIPVEPIVHECEYDLSNETRSALREADFKVLNGRRWKCRFEEIP